MIRYLAGACLAPEIVEFCASILHEIVLPFWGELLLVAGRIGREFDCHRRDKIEVSCVFSSSSPVLSSTGGSC